MRRGEGEQRSNCVETSTSLPPPPELHFIGLPAQVPAQKRPMFRSCAAPREGRLADTLRLDTVHELVLYPRRAESAVACATRACDGGGLRGTRSLRRLTRSSSALRSKGTRPPDKYQRVLSGRVCVERLGQVRSVERSRVFRLFCRVVTTCFDFRHGSPQVTFGRSGNTCNYALPAGAFGNRLRESDCPSKMGQPS